MRYQQRECQAAGCGLRFPVAEASELGANCPLCQSPTQFVGEVYDTHEITQRRVAAGPPVEALLDNIRSLSNVGSMFRTADGAGVTHMHLGGFTPTPAHPKFAKTALGAERSVAWSHHPDPAAAADALVGAGKRLWALEGGPRSRDLFELIDEAGGPGDPPIVLVLGHEVSGVDPRVVERCEQVVRIPMAGIKGSLNVSSAFGIAAYLLRHARGVVITPRG
ncbi:tRNA/rRNA methyltransferase (SpoU) [Enhygromyxa salina]|uniref:tRNA/rRNA methyltransferase (SpoU) n=1 Tax=Enhygromyxa salina TaxID=215803 RepID=A0A0C2D0L3_9BACT|nr:TrmH family RNA methyltransferase [Enhygromyxa salina]KIG16766.1 tRNA/rRNA methyltransferase (SpoU) [Enhygromyxa salina]